MAILDEKNKDAIKLIVIISLLCLVVHVANIWLGGALNDYGLLPRHITHLTGLVAYPFLHGSWEHLISNLISFALLALLVSRSGLARLLVVMLISWVGSGIGVWFFGRLSFHIGLSGIIYGLWAYLLIYALMYRSLKSIVIAVIVMFLYGSMVWGVLPVHQWVSFESHLFGALAGVVAGYLFAKRDKMRKKEVLQ
ncbi:rhomboid family intramembrane serine protease [Photobacterium sp.]|uniref:rhomboid family intramembrane serine protease n=1 Tax=Photobacterium sp. TaxID=660 RepID=UPI00299F4F71|nr:rhomboid family intramembrane serine protease [Photobacterium sp.]MDX1301554.1 rhomboid family intramembrane serine protease [Photobacterium sp.]